MTKASAAPFAPGRLEVVRAFVNTKDIEAGTDLLDDLDSWRRWAEERGLPGELEPGEVDRLRSLREAIREGVVANHDRQPLPEPTRAELDSASRWAAVVPRFTPEGLSLEPSGTAGRRVAGAVVSIVAVALVDGTWSRLKACGDDACKWAFYDHSRSRTGQWCSMELCGNRNKQARWRQRRS